MIPRFAAAPVARLATVTPDGRPHVVPIVFAVDGDVVYTAVDGKPKSSMRVRRLANIEANPRVSILVDHYADNWSQLWWVRADGTAAVWSNGPQCERGRALLRAKYPQYQDVSLGGPVIAVAVDRWSSWPREMGPN
ncbi:TIGR03668 family PPOX class F420-dependent oxidoreductase [Candidatus Mycolicibacterium alkanivorans]|uniref:TIGR03668 family PPOX class F420-dependent oxidoreductase n=1 Tax=Candidatus Mycolicibacterium alkanivorans TaxID=2954114 RepID=A0ABS9YQJ9_9MYCO|nr:TIGR03668 family PPOX class F420-dependent oxidoreductase [Candidatus Mycolicibacterium alkanivorans]MCI4673546.1 TIGR03668 family PPOX class F420-dependent oxidoreductase [Candidatus Mycolicibacterium alkanivorans]